MKLHVRIGLSSTCVGLQDFNSSSFKNLVKVIESIKSLHSFIMDFVVFFSHVQYLIGYKIYDQNDLSKKLNYMNTHISMNLAVSRSTDLHK